MSLDYLWLGCGQGSCADVWAGSPAPPQETPPAPKQRQPLWGEALLNLSGVSLGAKGFQPSYAQSALLRIKIALVADMGGFQKCPTEVKILPESEVAYIRRMGAYGPENCGSAFMELMEYAGPRNLMGPGRMLAIYWDNPEVTAPEQCRFDACIMVPEGTEAEGQICIQTIRGGSYAVHRAEIKPEEFQQAWQDAFVWLCDSGFEANDGPCFELYQNNAMEHPEGKWIVDICIPLKVKV